MSCGDCEHLFTFVGRGFEGLEVGSISPFGLPFLFARIGLLSEARGGYAELTAPVLVKALFDKKGAFFCP